MSDTTLQAALRAAFNSRLPTSGGTITGQVNFPNGITFNVDGIQMVATSNGDFLWNGISVEQVAAFDHTENNNYIRFESGLQICYGYTVVPSGSLFETVTFLAPFVGNVSAVLTADDGGVNCITTFSGVTNQNINISRRRYTDDSYNFDLGVFYHVLGVWK